MLHTIRRSDTHRCPKRRDDRFGNAQGNQYDLGQDGAFVGSTVAVLHLYTGEGFDFALPDAALKEKGFKTQRWTSVPQLDEMKRELGGCSQLWLISSNSVQLSAQHIEAIKEFWEAGNGVYIWGDNDPYYADANNLLKALMPGVTLHGNVPGDKPVQEKEKEKPSKSTTGAPGFVQHLITTGVEQLYEGITIATIQFDAPVAKAGGVALVPLVHGSAGNLVTAVQEARGGKGRLVLDGGFTRLFYKWDTAGTARYVKNAACWLDNREGRAGKGKGAAKDKGGKGHGRGAPRGHGGGKGGRGMGKLCPKFGWDCKFGASCKH